MIVIFLFFSASMGKQLKYTLGEHKHMSVICYHGDYPVIMELAHTGIEYRIISNPNMVKVIKNLKIIETLMEMVVVDVKEKSPSKWHLFLIRSCNEICRYISGVQIGLTLNPCHFLRKLIKLNKQKNYHILLRWRRDDGR